MVGDSRHQEFARCASGIAWLGYAGIARAGHSDHFDWDKPARISRKTQTRVGYREAAVDTQGDRPNSGALRNRATQSALMLVALEGDQSARGNIHRLEFFFPPKVR